MGDVFMTYLAAFDANEVQFACTGLTDSTSEAAPDAMERFLAHPRTDRVEIRDAQDQVRGIVHPAGKGH